MKNLLIVEDNKISGSLISAKVSASLNFSIYWVKTLREAVELLDKHENDFFAALLDYVLPDAPQGEIVDEVVSRGISSIVFTATVTKEVREKLWQMNIVDYVIKDDAQSIEYLTFLLSRLEKNLHIKILLISKSKVLLAKLTGLLKIHNYQVLQTSDGKEALSLIRKNKDIKLVITENSILNIDGLSLTRQIRKKHGRDNIVILGLADNHDKMIGAQFIKNGANDFIDKKTFFTEELYCRVNQNLQNLESMQLINTLATIDHLSGLYNRRYFYELAHKLYSNAKRSNAALACAILDIDHFKQFNDNYGHAVGDQVIKNLSDILTGYFQRTSDLVGRMGGEEFAVLLNNVKPKDTESLFEKLREAIEKSIFYLVDGRKISFTVSIGVCTVLGDELDFMLNRADELLYMAKNEGRNKIVIDLDR